MIKLLLITSIIFLFTACDENKLPLKLDGKKLLEKKCASCHDLNMPPVVSDDELAPPMMAVAFHVHNFVKPNDESQRISKAVEFVVDYVHHPSFEKSFCDKDSLKRYGLMPSQKNNLSKDEAKVIAKYMFMHFTQANLTKVQKEKAEYNSLSIGKKTALKYKCLGCHREDKKIVGPSFRDIAKRYSLSKEQIEASIKSGSKAKWKNSNSAVMPPFKQIDDEELKVLSEWILKSNS